MSDSHFNRKTNLLIIGSMKSGTTSLHNYLNLHPEIYMCEAKEPGYFVEEITWSKGEDWYHSLFSKSTAQHRYIGESSTAYTKLPRYQGVAERIKKYNTNMRLIYIMRNPLERIISHYWHTARDVAYGGLPKNIYEAYLSESKFSDYSNYPKQIKPYLNLFDHQQIHFVLFDELIKQPSETLNEIFSWLGLDEIDDINKEQKAHNKKPEKLVGVKGKGLLNKFGHSALWERVSPLVPQIIKNLAWKQAYTEINQASQDKYIAKLKEHYQPQLDNIKQEIADITGKDVNKRWQI